MQLDVKYMHGLVPDLSKIKSCLLLWEDITCQQSKVCTIGPDGSEPGRLHPVTIMLVRAGPFSSRAQLACSSLQSPIIHSYLSPLLIRSHFMQPGPTPMCSIDCLNVTNYSTVRLSGTAQHSTMSHASLFFASYEYFNLNLDVTPTKEFLRLKQLNGWKNDDGEYAEARQRFADALAEDFNAAYGTDINNINHWHALCHVLGIDPIPEGISACRKAVRSKHINLVDLVYHADKVEVFPSVKALAKYSKKQNKIFPRASAKAGGILRYLLRHIFGGGT
ncbi:hypothetical protein BJV78DRAFT_1193282 [Lactifluus subvellereus]|nr:hypothetical protein BJV78DRAFT_1193282 [Lactifluus subvellereus]